MQLRQPPVRHRGSSGLRLVLVGFLTFLGVRAFPSAASSFTCRQEGGQAVPCTIFAVPADTALPLVVAKSGEERVFAPGQYVLRAGAPGLALAQHRAMIVVDSDAESTTNSAALPLGPGGEVDVSGLPLPPEGAAEVLSLTSGRVDILFLRREHRIPFPVGSVAVVGLAGPNRVVGVTAPWDLGTALVARPESFHRPKDGTGNLLVRVDYPQVSLPRESFDVEVGLTRPPDVSLTPVASSRAPTRAFYALFLDVPAGVYALRIATKRWMAPSASVNVRIGETVIAEDLLLREKPTLSVTLQDERPSEKQEVSLWTCEDRVFAEGYTSWPDLGKCTLVGSRVIQPPAEAIFRQLESRRYFVRASSGLRRLGRRVDLRAGESRREDFRFETVKLLGRILRGDHPLQAEATFKDYDSDEVQGRTISDFGGGYGIDLWNPGTFRVQIEPPEQSGAPPEALFIKTTVGLNQQDLTLPERNLVLRVLDEAARKGVRSARVSFQTAWEFEELQTNESGEIALPSTVDTPLRGRVSASGYGSTAFTFSVRPGPDPQVFEVVLKHSRDDESFSAVLPSGLPAAEALVFVQQRGATQGFLRIGCDEAGVCRLTGQRDSPVTLWILHPSAGVTPVSSEVALRDGVVPLLPRAGDLAVEVQRGPVAAEHSLQAAVSVGDIPVPGEILFATSSLTFRIAVPLLTKNAAYPFQFFGLPQGRCTLYVFLGQQLRTGYRFEAQPTASTALDLTDSPARIAMTLP
jgi:hypothetical protein